MFILLNEFHHNQKLILNTNRIVLVYKRDLWQVIDVDYHFNGSKSYDVADSFEQIKDTLQQCGNFVNLMLYKSSHSTNSSDTKLICEDVLVNLDFLLCCKESNISLSHNKTLKSQIWLTGFNHCFYSELDLSQLLNILKITN